MSIETGRTDFILAGRASHAGAPCPATFVDPRAPAAAPAPIVHLTKSRRSTFLILGSLRGRINHKEAQKAQKHFVPAFRSRCPSMDYRHVHFSLISDYQRF